MNFTRHLDLHELDWKGEFNSAAVFMLLISWQIIIFGI